MSSLSERGKIPGDGDILLHADMAVWNLFVVPGSSPGLGLFGADSAILAGAMGEDGIDGPPRVVRGQP